MPRVMIMVVGVLSLFLAACSSPDVVLGLGDDPTAPAAPADAQPPDEPPYLEGPVTSIARTKPVTTGCVSEWDPDGDGMVSSNDPPVCNPNPETFGTVGVKGDRADQGGETEMVASVKKTVPIARRTDDGELETIPFDELSKGDVVSLWITGQVMESYPMQGEAAFIVVEE